MKHKILILIFLLFIIGCKPETIIKEIIINNTIIKEVAYPVEKIVYINNTIEINNTVPDKNCERGLSIYMNRLAKCENKLDNCIINNKTDNIALLKNNNTKCKEKNIFYENIINNLIEEYKG